MSKQRVNKVQWIAQQTYSKKIKLERDRSRVQKTMQGIEKTLDKLIQEHIKALTENDVNKIVLHTIGEYNKKEVTVSLNEIGVTIQKDFYFHNEEALKRSLVGLETKGLLNLTPHGYILKKPVKVKSQIQTAYLGVIKRLQAEIVQLTENKKRIEKEMKGLDCILETLNFTVNHRSPFGKEIVEYLKNNKNQSFSFQDFLNAFPQKSPGNIAATIKKLRSGNKSIQIDEEKSNPKKYFYKYTDAEQE